MNITADECAECGSTLEEVRPGKWQCTKCELDQMLTDMYNAGYQAGLSKAQADHDYKMMGEGMRPNYIKYNFGKHYAKKPLTPFQTFYGDGFEESCSHHDIAEDAWNAALYTAKERLQMYGETYKKLTDLLCRIHRDGGQAIGKYGVDKAYVDAVEIVLQTFDRAEKAESELARYKQGVEVEDFVNHYGVLEAEFELRPDLWGKRVRVLVMKEEE